MTRSNKDTAMQAMQSSEPPSRPSAKALRLLQPLDAEIAARRASTDLQIQSGKGRKTGEG